MREKISIQEKEEGCDPMTGNKKNATYEVTSTDEAKGLFSFEEGGEPAILLNDLVSIVHSDSFAYPESQ